MPARDNFLDILAELDSVRQVLLKLRNRFIEMGAERMSYHLVPPLKIHSIVMWSLSTQALIRNRLIYIRILYSAGQTQ